MNYPKLLEKMLTHVETIDDEIGKRDTDLIQTEVDALWSLITETQNQQWIESILELQ
tara:strand:- start:15267 stop:15437 length:171 start_codon:yes stop_codon:yes gene_type:complete